MSLIGTLFDNKYQIITELGKGGMSLVYLARDIKLDKFWAIKQVKKDSISTTTNLMAEANILKKLDHSALPRIVDIIDSGESIYVVLDFIDGVSLDKKLQEEGPQDEKTVIAWAKQICDVLKYLHTQTPNPIIYRDMKPGNLMLTSQGKIKLIDFGIAREYKEDGKSDTTNLGTRWYAAPEQYGSHQTDGRTDIFSLGVTLYHLVTGRGPTDPPYVVLPIREVDPSLSEGLEYIIEKCVQPRAEDRYQNVDELLYDLDHVHTLNSAYKRSIRIKIYKMAAAVLAFTFFSGMTIKGFDGIKKEKEMVYQSYIEEGLSYRKAGKFEEAINSFKTAIEKDEGTSEAYLEIANIYTNDLIDKEGLISFFEKQLSKNQAAAKNPDVLYKLGMAYFETGNYSKASKNFESIKSDKFADLKYYKTISYALSNKVKETDQITSAVKDLEDYIEKNMDQNSKVDSYILLSSIYSTNPDVFKNSEDRVIEVLTKAESQSKDQNNYRLYEKIGLAYYNKALSLRGENDLYKEYLNKSLSYYSKVMNLGYKSSDIYRKRGIAYKYLGNFQESEKVFLEMINVYPIDFKGYNELALLYIDMEAQKKDPAQRNYDKVKTYYEAASKLPNSANNVEFEKLKRVVRDLGLIK